MARTNFNGWVKVQRKFMNWEFYDDAKAVKLFVHLLLCAAPESCVIDGVNLEAGEMKTSYRELAKTLNYSFQEIRTYLDKLTNSKTIEIKTKHSYSIIRLTKYNSYQKSNTQNNTPKAPQIGTSKGVSNTQSNTQKSNTQNSTPSNTQSNTQSNTNRDFKRC